MTSPYLQKRLRTFEEAVEDKLLKNLRQRHKVNDLANKKATIVQTGNIYRFNRRLSTKFGARS